jgi:hypothetical protein
LQWAITSRLFLREGQPLTRTICTRPLAAVALSALPLLAVETAVAAPTLTVTGVTAGPALGKIGAASVSNGGATTTFTVNAATGAITVAGSGGRVLSTTTKVTVTVKCTGGKCSSGGNGKIVAVGTPTGRMGSLNNFTVAGSGATVTSQATGMTLFTLPKSVSNNASETFKIGMDIPIAGDSSASPSGAATSAFLIQVAAGAAAPSGSTTGTATATVYRGLTISKISDLQFGSIVRPSSGGGTVTVNATTGNVSVTGTGVAFGPASTRSRAAFTVSGEGSETVTFSVPTTFKMTAGSSTLTVTTASSTTSPATLSGAAGAAGNVTLGVGGSFPFTNTTPFGAYHGTFNVTAAYN